MQGALDSTSLMLSRDLAQGTITAADIGAKASAYFKALYTSTDAQGVTITATYTASTSSSASNIQLSASGQIATQFMTIAGFPTMSFGAKTTSTWGDVKMRVALALDNTGSMASSGKMSALQNAVAGSGGLIDQLSALAKTPGDVYISVVPFAKVVNVGASNYSPATTARTGSTGPTGKTRRRSSPPTAPIRPRSRTAASRSRNGTWWDQDPPARSSPATASPISPAPATPRREVRVPREFRPAEATTDTSALATIPPRTATTMAAGTACRPARA